MAKEPPPSKIAERLGSAASGASRPLRQGNRNTEIEKEVAICSESWRPMTTLTQKTLSTSSNVNLLRKLSKLSLSKTKTGCVAGAMVSVCVQPLDVLRTRMQADAAAGRLQSTVRTLKAVLESQGTR